MILPIVLTTRNRSLRGAGNPVLYLDQFAQELSADGWEPRTAGVSISRTKTEQRLTLSSKIHGKLRKGSIFNLEVEFTFESFFAYTVSPSDEYAYFATHQRCGEQIFDELLEKQPSLKRFEWIIEPYTIFSSLTGETNDIFGLRIAFRKRPDLFSYQDCENYSIADLRF